MSLSADLRFETAADRHHFAEELANAVAELTAKYHKPQAKNGRDYRFIAGVYPNIPKSDPPLPQGDQK